MLSFVSVFDQPHIYVCDEEEFFTSHWILVQGLDLIFPKLGKFQRLEFISVGIPWYHHKQKLFIFFFQINVHVSTSYLWNLGMFNSPLFADFWSQSRQCWPWHGQADAGEDVWSAGKISSMQRLSWKHSVLWIFNVLWPLLLN